MPIEVKDGQRILIWGDCPGRPSSLPTNPSGKCDKIAGWGIRRPPLPNAPHDVPAGDSADEVAQSTLVRVVSATRILLHINAHVLATDENIRKLTAT